MLQARLPLSKPYVATVRANGQQLCRPLWSASHIALKADVSTGRAANVRVAARKPVRDEDEVFDGVGVLARERNKEIRRCKSFEELKLHYHSESSQYDPIDVSAVGARQGRGMMMSGHNVRCDSSCTWGPSMPLHACAAVIVTYCWQDRRTGPNTL